MSRDGGRAQNGVNQAQQFGQKHVTVTGHIEEFARNSEQRCNHLDVEELGINRDALSCCHDGVQSVWNGGVGPVGEVGVVAQKHVVLQGLDAQIFVKRTDPIMMSKSEGAVLKKVGV